MRRVFILLIGLRLLIAPSAFADKQEPAASAASIAIAAPKTGVVLPNEICAAHTDQSYALYVPSTYTPEKKWPVVYFFDPSARGSRPVELMKDAAERYGYILAGSNNSSNGAWKTEFDAAQAVTQDTRQRLSIDDHLIYFSGFSGGARVAGRLAQLCKCAAGVLLSGAGFPSGTAPSHDLMFPVFAAVGDFDFNNSEVTHLDENMDAAGFTHFLRYFDGKHEWALSPVMDEALVWFRLVAMKQNLVPRDAGFIGKQRELEAARARAFEQSGDLFSAWREYRQAAAMFDQLADVTAFRQEVASLAAQKATREGAKRQKAEFDEQGNLTNDISAGIAGLRQLSTNMGESITDIDRKIVDLREAAEREKRPDRARVLKRAISGVFVAAIESGNDRLEAKDITLAKAYFQFAASADPESMWAHNNLAVAKALGNDRKGAIEALRRGKAKSKDLAAFSSWVQAEPAFASLHNDPQFRALISN